MGERIVIGVTEDDSYKFPLSYLKLFGFMPGDVVEFKKVKEEEEEFIVVHKVKSS